MMEIVADRFSLHMTLNQLYPSIQTPNLRISFYLNGFKNKGSIDKEQFHILEENINDQDDIHSFCRQQLAVELPRDDYWEILELTTIYLLATPSRSIRFMQPGKFSPSS